MISLGDHYGIEMNTLQGAWETNKMVRPDKDWEKLEGRAVVKEDKVKEWLDKDPLSHDEKLQHLQEQTK